eukprot:43252-Eustigmatos_ZCMA.PRE.1
MSVTVHLCCLDRRSSQVLQAAMDIQELDEEYEKRMVAFEVDCDQGRGDQWACHSVGEFLSVVK